MLRRFGPLLASRYSGKVFTNRIGTVVVVDELTCSAYERDYLDDAVRWIRDGSAYDGTQIDALDALNARQEVA